jgi:Xaa-Pro aminopeptidase
MHYRATEARHSVIEGDNLLLIDSGGQYLGGTTDITRVVAVGQITAEHRRDFTLVLKGMIALSAARFPRGAKSPMLDAIARAPLWAEGMDFGHGTGHGVGYFLNVHEGPQSISPSTMPEPHTAMEPGMITSIEPGLYRPGRWGIRIENLVLNRAAGQTEFGEFLNFETLTLCPIDTRCIDAALLRDDEKRWLNDYHATVRSACRRWCPATRWRGCNNVRRPYERPRHQGHLGGRPPETPHRQPEILDVGDRQRPLLPQRRRRQSAAVCADGAR